MSGCNECIQDQAKPFTSEERQKITLGKNNPTVSLMISKESKGNLHLSYMIQSKPANCISYLHYQEMCTSVFQCHMCMIKKKNSEVQQVL